MKTQVVLQTGTVKSVDYAAGTVCVTFTDISDSGADDIPMFGPVYKMPDVGDTVACIFLDNNPARDFCLGKPFSDDSLPVVSGKGIFCLDLFGEGFIKYDRASKTLTLHADHVVTEQKGGS